MNNIEHNFTQHTLDNGMHIILQDIPTGTISAKLRIHYGAINEEVGEEGLAHFLEHVMVVGGSQRFSPEQVQYWRREFGYFNVGTNLERTRITGNLLPDDLEVFLDLSSSAVFHPSLPEDRIEQERLRILNEMRDEESSPSARNRGIINKALYGNHPGNRIILGKEEVVKKATAQSIRNFHNRGYTASNMDLILVGRLPNEDIIHKFFIDQRSGKRYSNNFPLARPLEKRVTISTPAPEFLNHGNPKNSSAQVYVAFRAPPDTHEDSILMRVLANCLYRNLYRSISEKHGLSYKVGSSYESDFNRGAILTMASVQSNKQEQVADLIFEELSNLRNTPIDEDELRIQKRTGLYGLKHMLESPDGILDLIEYKLDSGFTAQDVLRRWESITSEKVLEAAQKYIPNSREGGCLLYIRDPMKKI